MRVGPAAVVTTSGKVHQPKARPPAPTSARKLWTCTLRGPALSMTTVALILRLEAVGSRILAPTKVMVALLSSLCASAGAAKRRIRRATAAASKKEDMQTNTLWRLQAQHLLRCAKNSQRFAAPNGREKGEDMRRPWGVAAAAIASLHPASASRALPLVVAAAASAERRGVRCSRRRRLTSSSRTEASEPVMRSSSASRTARRTYSRPKRLSSRGTSAASHIPTASSRLAACSSEGGLLLCKAWIRCASLTQPARATRTSFSNWSTRRCVASCLSRSASMGTTAFSQRVRASSKVPNGLSGSQGNDEGLACVTLREPRRLPRPMILSMISGPLSKPPMHSLQALCGVDWPCNCTTLGEQAAQMQRPQMRQWWRGVRCLLPSLAPQRLQFRAFSSHVAPPVFSGLLMSEPKLLIERRAACGLPTSEPKLLEYRAASAVTSAGGAGSALELDGRLAIPGCS
mmetsp:Transcript_14935/g.41282  ORF Transcript_14935/g.41282 Transcript_14935/m.41282 type:complete len:459 (+) Transcript_14935:1332-2708(+)